MPLHESKYGCAIPRDYAARRECFAKGVKFGAGSKDAHSAAVDYVNHIARTMAYDPLNEPMDRKSMAIKVQEIEKGIQAELDKEWAKAEAEHKEREKVWKEKGEQIMKERLADVGEAIAQSESSSEFPS